MPRLLQAKLVCVNELGRERLHDARFNANLDELLAEREYGGKLTIFATNLPMERAKPDDPPALSDRYGDLFVSRVAPPRRAGRHPIGAYVLCERGAVDAPPAPPSAMPNSNPKPFNELGER
jgi:hypothetical protein